MRAGATGGSLLLVLALGGVAGGAGAQVSPIAVDDTFGSPGDVVPVGNDFPIGDGLGEYRGNNLFHSFARFGVPDGMSATFSATLGAPQNVFGRVTGGAPSTVHGTIRSTIPGANLYLFNPAGIAFGQNAKIDVMGSFTASTADYVRFREMAGLGDTLWPTGAADALPGNLLRLAGTPSAFGFLSEAPAPISFDIRNDPFTERVGSQGRVTLVGGDITISGRAGNRAQTIEVPGGRIELASVGGGGVEVDAQDVSAWDVAAEDPSRLGSIRLEDGAWLDVTGPFGPAGAGGRVVIRGGELVVTGDSRINAGTIGDVDGDPVAVDVQVAGSVTIEDDADVESRSLFGLGRGGDIRIRASDLVVDGSIVSSESVQPATIADGMGGDIVIEVTGSVAVRNGGSVISSSGGILSCPCEGGPGGDVVVTADRIEVTGGGEILTQSTGSGRSGSVELTARSVRVSELVQTLGGPRPSRIGASALDGQGGDLEIRAGAIDVTDGGLLTVQTIGDGDAGTMTLRAGRIRVAGHLASVAGTGDEGDGAQVVMRAGQLTIADGAVVSVSATRGGDAGDIDIRAPVVTVAGTSPVTGTPSAVAARSTAGATGAGGTIRIVAPLQLSVVDGGEITSASTAAGGGLPGNVKVWAGNVQVRGQGSSINATARVRDAGNVDIVASNQVVIEDGTVSTRSEDASGGNILVSAARLLLLRGRDTPADQALVTAQVSDLAATVGGNVTLASSSVAVDRAGVSASAPQGRGGNITVESVGFFVNGGGLREIQQGLYVSDGSFFDVSGALETGDFVVRAPDAAVVEELASLSEKYLDASGLEVAACVARETPVGSLTVRGRDRVPASPADALDALIGEL